MSKEKQKEFGAYLRKLREGKYTVRGLAEKSGVSSAYLSLLENGKKGIPSPEILKKLYGPLEVTYDELMEKAGHISPKLRSELIPETIQTMEDNALGKILDYLGDMIIGELGDEKGALSATYRQDLIRESQQLYSISKEEAEELFSRPDIIPMMYELSGLEGKIHILNLIIKDLLNQGMDLKDLFKEKYLNTKENVVPVLTVPLLGCIAAGQPILADDHIEEWVDIPNMWNLKQGEVFVLRVKGDSMIGSRIFEGDRVIVKIQQEVENGEIAVVNVNGDEATLKRVKKTENGQVILYPDNPRYEPIFIVDEKARIIGKVIQVMFEPK